MLFVKFVTPEKTLFEANAIYVSLSTTQGSIGIYKDHQPFLGLLKKGVVKIEGENKKVKNFQVETDEGFIEMESNNVLITCPKAKELSYAN